MSGKTKKLKRNLTLGLSAFLFLGTSACGLREDAATLYKQETPLQVEIKNEPKISANQETEIQAVLAQDGQAVMDADFMHVEIQKQDGTVAVPMEEARNEGHGIYSFSMQFKEDGLYYIRIHAGNEGSLISPRKQIIVGELTEAELELLKQGPKNQGEASGHHH